MIKKGCLFFFSLIIANACFSQNFGNSPYLKYGFTPNDLSMDVLVNGFTLSNSPSKAFVLRNYNSTGFAVSSFFRPIDINTNGESSGESIGLGYVSIPQKVSIGYRHSTHRQDQVHTTWNGVAFKKSEKMRVRVSGYLFAGNQTFDANENSNGWSRFDETLNGFISLSRFNTSAKNNLKFEGTTILNNAHTNTGRFWFRNNFKGGFYLGRLVWSRRLSANHTISGNIQGERFSNRYGIFQKWANNWPNTMDFAQVRLSLFDAISMKRKRIENGLVLTDNQTKWNLNAADMHNRYQLAVINSTVTHFFKPNVIGIKYNHSAGYHSYDGALFNPGIKFFHKLKSFNYDVGFIQTSRTPALSTEFGTFTTFSADTTQFNLAQETYRKLFATTKFEISSMFNIEFKYVLTSSPNKWMFDPVLKTLKPTEIQYTSMYAKIARDGSRNSKYEILYRYNRPESRSAEILPSHFVSGKYEYRLDRKTMRLFKRYRRYDLTFDINGTYLSSHQLPFMNENAQAVHKGGFFADSHLKLRVSRQDYDYYYNQENKAKTVEHVVLQLGVSNILNTQSTIQPEIANNFKPIMPRQITTSLILEF